MHLYSELYVYNMVRTFRLAVLECDTPFPATEKARGSYANIFRDLLSKGRDISGSSVQLDVTKWDVVEAQEYPNVDQVDGFLLTGSSRSPCPCTGEHGSI